MLLLVLGGIALLIILILFSLFFIPVRALVAAGWGREDGCALFQASWAGLGARIRTRGRETRVEYLFLGMPVRTSPRWDRRTASPASRAEGHERLPVLSVLRILPRLVRPLAGFGIKLIQATTFQEIRAQLVIGLKDPASTGQLYGWYCALSPLLAGDRLSMQVSPVFDRQVFEGEIRARFRIDRPLLLIGVIAATLLNPDVRRGISLLRGGEYDQPGP
ncbi:MAG TPA: DUF2953 domain-containing protein [Methanomicrobiales archaeon]|nr:DUF2953 domain-containing protein [Methanomicrobiales archaeon]